MTRHPDETTDDQLLEALQASLHHRETAMDIDDGDVTAVTARGRRRQLATRVGSGVAAIALVGLGVTAMAQLASPPDVVEVPESEAPTAPSTPAPVAPTGSPTTTPAPGPTTTPAPGPTATPAPSPTAAPTPVSTATPNGGEPSTPTTWRVVTAGVDGILRVDVDGTSTAIPGLEGPVDLAFDDGSGGVVFQRNPNGIGRLVDGQVATTVALASLQPRAFRDVTAPPFEDVPDVTLEPSALELQDVDPDTATMVYEVVYGAGSQQVRSVVVEATVDGGSPHEVTVSTSFEATQEHTLGGVLHVVNDIGQVSGQLAAWEVGADWASDDPVHLAWATETDFEAEPAVWAPQLDAHGTRMATTVESTDATQVVVRRVPTGEVLATVDVDPGMRTTDLRGDVVVVSDGTSSQVVNLSDGTTSAVPGRATLSTSTPTGQARDPRTEALPSAARLAHGGDAVALYLQVSDQPDADGTQVEQAARDLGYRTGMGDMGCDQGAVDGLGLGAPASGTWNGWALYFDTVADAQRVGDVLAAGGVEVVGTTPVTTYCLD